MSGRRKKRKKRLRIKKDSLRSVALVVQQHKNEVPEVRVKKVGEMSKCNRQWKHPKKSSKN